MRLKLTANRHGSKLESSPLWRVSSLSTYFWFFGQHKSNTMTGMKEMIPLGGIGSRLQKEG